MANGNDGNNGNGKQPLGLAFQIILIIVVAMVGWTIITEGSVLITEFFRGAQDHGRYLFDGPSIFPSNRRGFTKFIQLIMIAIFVGWAYSRFKRKK